LSKACRDNLASFIINEAGNLTLRSHAHDVATVRITLSHN